MSSRGPDGRAELISRRERLAAEVARLRSDLGGLTYEMAIRDHFRIEVLVRRAAILQERDAELAEVERLLSEPQIGAAGNCPSCQAVRSRAAVFCWQCGAPLMEQVRSETIGGGGEASLNSRGLTAEANAVASE